MATNNKNASTKKSKRQVPQTVKTIVTLAEVIARFITAYLLLNNFDHIVAIAIAWYMLITASMAFVAIVHKASKN